MRERERDEAAAEVERVEKGLDRIYETCKLYYPDVDGAGCDSGDPLDVAVAQINEVAAFLEARVERRDLTIENLEREKEQTNALVVREARRMEALAAEISELKKKLTLAHRATLLAEATVGAAEKDRDLEWF